MCVQPKINVLQSGNAIKTSDSVIKWRRTVGLKCRHYPATEEAGGQQQLQVMLHVEVDHSFTPATVEQRTSWHEEGPWTPPLPPHESKYSMSLFRAWTEQNLQCCYVTESGPAAPSAAQMQRRHRLCGLTALQQTHTHPHTHTPLQVEQPRSLHADLIWCFHHSDFFRSVNLKKGSGLTWCPSSGFCWADPEERCSLSRAGLMTGWLWAFKHTRTLMEEPSEIKLNIKINSAEICFTGLLNQIKINK